MVTYTISLDFFENLQGATGYKYIFNILYTILNSHNVFKIAIDKDGAILNKYIDVNPSFKAEIAHWINCIGKAPSSTQKTIAAITNLTDKTKMCLEICNKTRGRKKLIIYSYDYNDLNDENCISYNGCSIPVVDKDDADKEINPNNITNIYNVDAKDSNVAINGIINNNK